MDRDSEFFTFFTVGIGSDGEQFFVCLISIFFFASSFVGALYISFAFRTLPE
jgi:hypothetical protein